MILKSSENQLSRMCKSNLTQTWRLMCPFQFLKDSCIHRECLSKKNFGIDSKKLFKETAKPTC